MFLHGCLSLHAGLYNTSEQHFKLGLLQGGYDIVIGTSEHGVEYDPGQHAFGSHEHILIVFGGPLGLEECFSKDQSLTRDAPHQYFSHYINTCPLQGSRTIRTEEAILISLAQLMRSH